MEIAVAKSGTKTQNGEIKKDVIYITLTGEYPENHPECICINRENKIYAQAPCMKNKAGQIISEEGLKFIANKLDKEVKEIKKWYSTHLFLSSKGEFMMKLTYDNGPIYTPYLHRGKNDEMKQMAHRRFRLKQEFNQFYLFLGCLVSVKNLDGATRYEPLNTKSLDLIIQDNDAWKDPKVLLSRIDSMSKYEGETYQDEFEVSSSEYQETQSTQYGTFSKENPMEQRSTLLQSALNRSIIQFDNFVRQVMTANE